jgi:hypothetical protein
MNNLEKYRDHLTEEEIALYVEAVAGDKHDLLPRDILNHVENCISCKVEISDTYKIFYQGFDQKENNKNNYSIMHPKKSGNFQDNFLKSLKWAFVIVCILFIGGLAGHYFLTSGKLHNSGFKANVHKDSVVLKPILASKGPDTLKDKKSHNSVKSLLAVNLKENDLFENIIQSGMRGNDLVVINPKMNQQILIKEPVLFEFKGLPDQPCDLKIYNNLGKIVYEKSKIITCKFSITQKFSSGLYYWKFTDKQNLLGIGKFIIIDNK